MIQNTIFKSIVYVSIIVVGVASGLDARANDVRVAQLEKKVADMQIQLEQITAQLNEQLIQARRASLERNVADIVEQLDRFDDILYEMTLSDAHVKQQLEILIAQFGQLLAIIEDASA